jgi:predicted PurR-regulated permease PerM
MSSDVEATGPVPAVPAETSTGPKPRSGMSITIAPQTILIFVGLATLTWAIVSVGGTLLVIFVAVFLAMVLSPVVDAAAKRWNLGRGAASSLVVLGLAVLVVVLLLITLAPLVDAVRSFVHNIPKITREIEHTAIGKQLNNHNHLGASRSASARPP